jgi:hypothetical protein
MDDIREKDLPEGAAASDGVQPQRDDRAVGPESEDRGGSEVPLTPGPGATERGESRRED